MMYLEELNVDGRVVKHITYDWINLSQDWVNWVFLVNTTMNLIFFRGR
jgi:hypothetical protein